MTTPMMRRVSHVLLGTLATFVAFLPASSIASSGDGGGTGQQAFGITSNFGKHTGGNINWVYNSIGAPAGWTDDATTLAAFQAAIDEWEGYCDLTFTSLGVDDSADFTNTGDNTVVFAWDNLGGAAGLAGPVSTSATLNSLGRWNYIDGSLRMDIGTFTFAGGTPSEQTRNQIAFHAVAVHELGHVIGLGHSDVPDSIMYANPYNSIVHTMQDDIDACRAMYGYSDIIDTVDEYTPPAAGADTYDFIYLAAFSDANTPITFDDGDPPADSDTLAVRWQHTAGTYPRTITQAVVDPNGVLSTIAAADIANPAGGAFGVASFTRLREMPGQWTVYVIDDAGSGEAHIATLTFDVNVSLPTVNEAPTSNFSFTENPATRVVSLTTNVTGDNEGDTAEIIWHIPGSSPTTVNLMGSSGSDTDGVTFNDSIDWEMFAEVNDDALRYTGANPGTGPAGPGFQTLYRYSSTGVNQLNDHSGDNSSDVLWRNTSTGQYWLYSMKGNFIDAGGQIAEVSDTNWQVVGDGDYNGDGKADILWRNTLTGQNWMYLMDGSTIASSVGVNTVSDQNWQVAGSGDYNGDGRSDILWRNSSNGQNWLYTMNGATISASAGINTVPVGDWDIESSGDFNGDGRSDILWRHGTTGQVWLYTMNGTTIDTSSAVGSVLPFWDIVGTGDYNGDGRSDVLWRRESTGQNWVYLMNGATISTSSFVSVVPGTDWTVQGSGDYNGDGNADILWRNSSTGQNWVNLMNGATITGSAEVNRVTDGNWQIVDARD